MDKKTFLFTYDDDSTYLAENVTLKEALVNAMEYYGGAYDFFRKSLIGFDDNDVKTMVALYAYFARFHSVIESIYVISEKIF